MKILVLKGSPHIRGSSNLLANQFIKGAKESGHDVEVIDVAHSNINPCLGCDYCGMNGACIQKDDMENSKEQILNTDMIVFVTPLYYFGFSSQIKLVIDRFYSFNNKLTNKRLKSALIAASWDSSKGTMDDLYRHYLTLTEYLNFDNLGSILGLGCGTVDMTNNTFYPLEAYNFGKSIK